MVVKKMISYGQLGLLLIVLNLWGCKKAHEAVLTLKFADHYNIKSHFDVARQELSVTLSLAPGFHAYASREHVGKPLRLEVSPAGGWQARGATLIPPGQLKNLDGLGLSDVLTGTINMSQKVIPGPQAGKALLHMQICTDSQCDQPRIHEISLP